MLSRPLPWSPLHPTARPSPHPQPHAVPSLWPLQGPHSPPWDLLTWGPEHPVGSVHPVGSAPPLKGLPQQPGAHSARGVWRFQNLALVPLAVPLTSYALSPSGKLTNVAGPSNRPPSPLPRRLAPRPCCPAPCGVSRAPPGTSHSAQTEPDTVHCHSSSRVLICFSAFPTPVHVPGARGCVFLVFNHSFRGPVTGEARKALARGKGGMDGWVGGGCMNDGRMNR